MWKGPYPQPGYGPFHMSATRSPASAQAALAFVA